MRVILMKILSVILYPFAIVYEFVIQRFNELFFILLNLTILVVSFLIQCGAVPIPQWLVLKSVDPAEFYTVLFQSQVTISTLSMAIVALISGQSSTKYYGITVISYVFKLKPKLLTHRVIIFFSFFFILLDSLFLANGWYNLIPAMLLCSVFFCARMAFDVISALLKGSDINTEIQQYITERCDRSRWLFEVLNLFNMISSDIEESVKTNNTVTLFEDLDILFKKVAYKVFSVDWTNPFFPKREFTYADFADLCREAIEPLLGSEQIPIINRYFKSMQYIYDMFSFRKTSIYIWEKVDDRVFTILAIIDPSALLATGSIHDLRISLYGNINEYPDTWEGVIHFLPSLHHALISNKYYLDNSEQVKRQYWREFVYNHTIYGGTYHEMIGSLELIQKARSQELFLLLNDAADTSDHLLLSEIYPLERACYKIVNLAMMAYVYCQINRGRIKEDEQGFYTDLFELYHSHQNTFLLNYPDLVVKDCIEIIIFMSDLKNVIIRFYGQAFPEDLLIEFCLLYQLSHYNANHDEEFSKEWNLFIDNEKKHGIINDISYSLKVMHLEQKLHDFLGLMGIPQNEEDYNAALLFYQKFFSLYNHPKK